MNCLRPKDAAKKIGISRMQLHRWATDPAYVSLNFPRPFKIGPNTTGYSEQEIDDWLAEQAAKRDAAPEPEAA